MAASGAIRRRHQNAGQRLRLEVASSEHYPALVEARVKAFECELGIQERGYRDGFNEACSKTLIVLEQDHLAASVRLALSVPDKRFFASYLTVDAERRHRAGNAVLIGALLMTLRSNQLAGIYADAHPAVLAMYERFGFTKIAEPRRKPGFSCLWHMMHYRLGTNHRLEEYLGTKARMDLRQEDLSWRFPIGVLPVGEAELGSAVQRAMCRYDFGSVIPTANPGLSTGQMADILRMLSPSARVRHAAGEEELTFRGPVAETMMPQHEWNTGHYLVTGTGGGLRDSARMYASLARKTLCSVEALRLHSDGVRSVLIVSSEDEAHGILDAVGEVVGRRVPVGCITGDIGTVSWVLAKTYIAHLQASWLVASKPVALPVAVLGAGAESEAMRLLATTALTHVVLDPGGGLRLDALHDTLRCGLSAGAACSEADAAGPLFGDPALQFVDYGPPARCERRDT